MKLTPCHAPYQGFSLTIAAPINMLNKAPKRLSVTICDDIRTEQGNKVSLLGVYSDGIIFPADVDPNEMRVPQFSVYASFENPKTPCITKTQILQPSKTVLFESPAHNISDTTSSVIAIGMKLVGFRFPETGEYSVVFWFDDKKSVFKFRVAVGF